MKSRHVSITAAILFQVCLVTALAAQETTTLSGTIRDPDGQPVSDARIMVAGLATSTLSDVNGNFRLVVPSTASHIITVAKPGFAPYRLRIALTDAAVGPRELGIITLQTLPTGAVTLSGPVTDAESGMGIPEAVLTINGAVRSATDHTGAFWLVVEDVQPSRTLSIVVMRMGFERLVREFLLPVTGTEFELNIELRAQPVALAEIVVEGERVTVSPFLRGFYQRREVGSGQYLTADDIEKMNALRVSDVLRRIQGLLVVGRDGPLQEPTYRFHASGFLCQQAVLFVDGVRVPSSSFGLLATPDRIAGIEAYRGATTPVIFGATGCGAIAVWTKPPGLDGGTTSPVSVGFHLGANIRGGVLRAGRVGAQFAMAFVGPFEFYPGFNTIFSQPSGGSGWQLLLNLRAWPLGNNVSPWYVGGGVTVIRTNLPPATAYPMLLTGIMAREDRLHPFAELHLVDITHPSDRGLYMFVGLNVDVGR